MAEAGAGTAVAIASAQATSVASAVANAVATATAGVAIGLGYASGQAVREVSGVVRDLSKGAFRFFKDMVFGLGRLMIDKPEIGITGALLIIYLYGGA